jgi:transcriptional regulator with XRE-family HTH domain
LCGKYFCGYTLEEEVEILPYNIGPRAIIAFDRLGISQAELARRSGINWAQLWKIMRGERKNGVSSETIRRLSGALGCTSDFLLGLSGEMEMERNAPVLPCGTGCAILIPEEWA